MRTLLLFAAAAASVAASQPAGLEAQRRARLLDRDESRAAALSASADAARLEAELKALEPQGGGADARVAEAGDRLAALNAAEAELSERVGRNRAVLARLLGALELFRRDPPPALIVSPQSVRDAARAAMLIQALTPELQRRARALGDEARALQTVRRQAAVASGVLFSAESDAADRRARLASALKGATEEAKRLGASGERAAAEARALQARAAAAGLLPEGASAAPETLQSPVRGAVTRRFGEDWPGKGRSDGLAWTAPAGAPVVSPAEGRVDYAGPLKGWRVVLILRLEGGYHLVLAGLDEASVRAGAAVQAGAPVGRMPRGRRAPDTAELYLELRRGETPVDPARWFAAGHESIKLASVRGR